MNGTSSSSRIRPGVRFLGRLMSAVALVSGPLASIVTVGDARALHSVLEANGAPEAEDVAAADGVAAPDGRAEGDGAGVATPVGAGVATPVGSGVVGPIDGSGDPVAMSVHGSREPTGDALGEATGSASAAVPPMTTRTAASASTIRAW